jgi:signal transduction histidine kinase
MHELAFLVMTEIELRAQVKARRQAEKALQQYADMLELKVSERTLELRHAYERLQGLDLLKSKFIDDISHELRTPISNINLYLDLLTRGKQESQAKYEAILKKESARLVSLLDGILDFSTLQQNLDNANPISIDLNALVAKEVADFEQIAQSRGLKLSFSPSTAALQVCGDAAQLEQAVINLLKNAIRYTPSGHIRVSTHQTSKGDPIRLTIEDSGMGMDEEELTHCFERFYRGKRVGQYNIAPGAGLGLAKVEDIVAFHKGWVEVESEIGRGSIFSVHLPACKGNENKRNGSLLHASRKLSPHRKNGHDN